MKSHLILIVDDENSNRNTLRRVLEREEYRVLESENGKQALALLQTVQPALLITDLKMPKMNGLELLTEVKDLYPNIEVIMMTAYGTVETAVEAMKQGAWDFISKPIKRADLVRAVRKALEKRDLLLENQALKEELANVGSGDWVNSSPAMQKLTEEARQVADSEASVFLVGESGTGKSMLARWIHNRSPRKHKKFITLNCGAIPETLLETELFGHEAGAFTGAKKQRKGRFEVAHQGTLFLDEVTEMSPHLQVKFLRVLQDGEFERIGGHQTMQSDVRIIAATNRNPIEEIKKGNLREDLYYRLNVIPLELPPLRERKEDILILARHFAFKHAERNRRPPKEITPTALEILANWTWSGNVRELQNVLERAVVLCRGENIDVQDLPVNMQNYIPSTDAFHFRVGTSLKDVEKRLIQATLQSVDGDKNKAAKILGITARTLYRREAEWK